MSLENAPRASARPPKGGQSNSLCKIARAFRRGAGETAGRYAFRGWGKGIPAVSRRPSVGPTPAERRGRFYLELRYFDKWFDFIKRIR